MPKTSSPGAPAPPSRRPKASARPAAPGRAGGRGRRPPGARQGREGGVRCLGGLKPGAGGDQVILEALAGTGDRVGEGRWPEGGSVMAKTAQGKNGAGHQVAMVFDLNKCIGCQTCSVACKVLWTRG